MGGGGGGVKAGQEHDVTGGLSKKKMLVSLICPLFCMITPNPQHAHTQTHPPTLCKHPRPPGQYSQDPLAPRGHALLHRAGSVRSREAEEEQEQEEHQQTHSMICDDYRQQPITSVHL